MSTTSICVILSLSALLHITGVFAQSPDGISGGAYFHTLPPAIPPATKELNPRNPFVTFQNVKVNHDLTTSKQVEVSVDVSPIDPNRVVATWVSYQTGQPRVAYGYSSDGGSTWSDALLPGNIGGFPYQSDPSVSADKLGNFFIAFISFDNPSGNTYFGGVWVAKSTNGGVTWPDTSMKRLDPQDDITFDDKPYIAISKTNDTTANYIYVAWDHIWGINQIHFSRSTNGGLTFSTTPKIVSDENRWYQLGAMPAVGPDGTVYVVWYYGFDYAIRNIMLDKSTNGGYSFGTDTPILGMHQFYNVSGAIIFLHPRATIFPTPPRWFGYLATV